MKTTAISRDRRPQERQNFKQPFPIHSPPFLLSIYCFNSPSPTPQAFSNYTHRTLCPIYDLSLLKFAPPALVFHLLVLLLLVLLVQRRSCQPCACSYTTPMAVWKRGQKCSLCLAAGHRQPSPPFFSSFSYPSYPPSLLRSLFTPHHESYSFCTSRSHLTV